MNPKDLDVLEQRIDASTTELETIKEQLLTRLQTFPRMPSVENVDAWSEWLDGAATQVEEAKRLLEEVGFLEGLPESVEVRAHILSLLEVADDLLENMTAQQETLARMRPDLEDLERLGVPLPLPAPGAGPTLEP